MRGFAEKLLIINGIPKSPKPVRIARRIFIQLKPFLTRKPVANKNNKVNIPVKIASELSHTIGERNKLMIPSPAVIRIRLEAVI